MLPQTKMQKFLYKAHAVALRGSIRKPYFQELGDHLAISTYAGSATQIECTSRGFAVGGDVSYDSAHTEIATSVANGVFQTTLVAQVKGLQIAKRIKVDEVTCRLRSVYDSKNYPKSCYPRISPAGSTIQNLQIDGRAQQLRLPEAFHADDKTTGGFFQGERDQDGTLQPGTFPEPIYVKGLGTIFYAEWTWVHPQERHQQHLTMLRLALGSDFGLDCGVSGGTSDGVGWPPGA